MQMMEISIVFLERNSRIFFLTVMVIVPLLLHSCTEGNGTVAPPPIPSTETSHFSEATQTPFPTPTRVREVVPTEPEGTKEVLPTITPVPFQGEIFDSDILWDDVIPVEYIEDQCEYLRLRWDPDNSPPGTIVAPIMFHSVRKSGRPITDSTSISEEYFHAVLTHASDLGFETITTEELIAFLTTNARIPPRSMIMFLDDRRPGVTERFLPYLVLNDWTLALGWIIEDQREYLWDWMETLAESGRLDVQSHGYWHRYIVEETSEEIISEEIYGPIQILEEHFGYRPIAFIWPGGNFTERSIQIAHEAGYQIGFGAYAHGPLLFNWVPQTEKEIALGDPLMTLPRYWSTVAWRNLDQALQISEDARTHARDQYTIEAEWYRQSCGDELPPAPD
jgi:peptidoglycan/xylan/chitin deacetylase (PgdA/CDA1 family)